MNLFNSFFASSIGRVLVFAGVFALSINAYSAQEVDDSAMCLAFPDALFLNARLDPQIGEARTQQERAAARLSQIKSDSRPRLSSYGRTASGQSGLVDGRTENQVGVVLSQRLYDFGQNKSQRNAASARLNSSRLEVDNVLNESSLEAAVTFLQVLEAKESLVAALNREDHLKSISAGVARRLETNLITFAEASSIQADRANATANRIEFELSVAEAEAKLAILTDTSNKACENIQTIKASLEEIMPFTLAAAIMASTRNAELQAAVAGEKAALAELKASNRSRAPVIEMQAVAATIYDKELNRWDPSNRIGLEISTPLYGGRYKGQVAEARSNYSAAKLATQRLKREITETTSLTWQRIHSYEDLAKSRREASASLELEAEALRKEFSKGLRTYQEIERVEADLQLALLQAIEARFIAHQQRLRLLAITNSLYGRFN